MWRNQSLEQKKDKHGSHHVFLYLVSSIILAYCNSPAPVLQERCGLRRPWMSLRSWHIVLCGDPCRPSYAATLTLRSAPGQVSNSLTIMATRSAHSYFNFDIVISYILINICLICSHSPSTFCFPGTTSYITCNLPITDCGCGWRTHKAGLCCQLPGCEWEEWERQSWVSAEDAGEAT